MNSRRRVNSIVMRLLLSKTNRAFLLPLVFCSAISVAADDVRKFDEIRSLAWPDLMARLDNVAINFQQQSSQTVLYLLAYSGPHACVGDADRLNLRAKTYLVAKRGIDSRRIILIDGGYLDTPVLEVWMLPSDISPPTAMPNIDRKLVRVKHCARQTSARRRRA